MASVSPMMSPPGRRASSLVEKMRATLDSIGVTEKHLAMQVVINGQLFWQSGTAGMSCGQHGISSGIAAMVAAAMAAPSTGAVNGPTTSPTIARIGSSLRNQALSFMGVRMPQAQCLGKTAGRHRCRRLLAAGQIPWQPKVVVLPPGGGKSAEP